MVQIDGSHGEGGGQILRTSLSLSVLTGKPVTVARVRAGRSKPGLQPQHLMAVRAAAALCDADTEGAAVGSTHLVFTPKTPPRAGEYRFEIGTAGAAALVLQTVLLPLALAPGDSRVTVTGGTHVPHAPTAEYLERVYGTLLRRSGVEASVSSPDVGFYPKGGGVIQAAIEGRARLQPLDLTQRGELVSLTAVIVTANLRPDVAARGSSAVRRCLSGLPVELSVKTREVAAYSPGAAVIVLAESSGPATGGPLMAGFSAIGERGKPMEQVAEEACAEFSRWWETDAACEEHLADQLVLPLSLAAGESRWSVSQVTEHLRTVLRVVEQFLPVEAVLEEQADGSGSIRIRGAGFTGGTL